MGPIFNKKVTEKCNLWDREQYIYTLFTIDKVNYCGLGKKKRKKEENVEEKRLNPNSHYIYIYLKGIKTGEWGLTGLTGPCPWAKRKSSPSHEWNPWWNKGLIWIGQNIGKILGEHLQDRGLFTMNNLSTTLWILEGRVLQGNNLRYKERRQNLTTIKVPIPPHIKVRIIYPSLAL